MLWERAKNVMILFFLLLNALLAWFLYREENRYTLTPDRVEAIYEVLRANHINWYKIERDFEPMKSLQVSGYYYDMEPLLPIFFEDMDKVSLYNDNGKDFYMDGNSEVVLSNGYITFTEYWENGGAIPTQEDAVERCQTFIDKHFPHYVADGIQEVENGLRVSYRELYQDYIIYGNFIEFLVTTAGIKQIDMQFGEVSGFVGQDKEIAAPDEALLTFVQWIRSLYPDTPVTINDMDIVYYQEEFSSQENVALTATPYYRFFVQDQDMPFLVNAYMNISLN